MNNVIRLTESQLNNVVTKILNEEKVYTNVDKSYDYKNVNGVWLAKNKLGNKWVDISKYPETIKRLDSFLKKDNYQEKIITSISKKDKINVVKGFQMFMNKNHKGWYNGSNFPTNKFGLLDSITKSSYLKYGDKYKQKIAEYKSNLPWYSWERISQAISDIGGRVVSTLTSNPVVKGFTHFFRKMFPNVAELFFARDLTTDDFTSSQKEIMFNTIQNAIKRNKNTKVGSTEYVDYGGGIEKEWFGPGGTKTSDMVLNTLFSNPKFIVATTLGRFSYKIVNGKIIITDIYDFKKIDSIKTTAKDLEGLTYPQKIWKIKEDNDVGFYLAIRQLGYLEHPDTDLNNKPKINIELDPQDFA